MKTLQLIWEIFQHDAIQEVWIEDDNRRTPIEAVEHLSAYWDVSDIKWRFSIIDGGRVMNIYIQKTL